MRIGFDGHFITGRATGNGVSTQLLLEALSQVDSENDYIIYVLQDSLRLRNQNFQPKMMRALHSFSHMRFLFTFPCELYRHPVDIFHATFTVPLLPDTTSTKIVLTLPEIPWFTDPDNFPASRFVSAQLRLTTRYSMAKADRIVTLTEFMKRQIVSYFNIAQEKVEVIPWGVNEIYFDRMSSAQIESVKNRFAIDRPYILCVGDLHPRKNQVGLIRAYTRLRERYNMPHQLVLVGKPLHRAREIYACAEGSSSRSFIKLLGYVEANDLRALYQGASIFAFPSLHEGFGLPVHEAMASAVPVITSGRDALPEIAGDAALFVDPLDVDDIAATTLRLIEDTSLRGRQIEKGLAQARRFSWTESGKKVVAVYRDVFLENGRG